MLSTEDNNVRVSEDPGLQAGSRHRHHVDGGQSHPKGHNSRVTGRDYSSVKATSSDMGQ